MSLSVDRKLLKLQQETGYKIVQVKGQRVTGPPPFWTGAPPPKGTEIFVGKLPRDVFEDELFPLFQTAGVIYEFRLMMDFSCSNRGFAFVNYATKEEAQRAICTLNNYQIREGRRIGVLKSVDNSRLYIGGLPTDKSEDDIFSEITMYTPGVSKVAVYSCAEMQNLGFAFVEYNSHRAASMARKILIPTNVKLFGREISVDWAKPEPEIGEEKVEPHWNIPAPSNDIPRTLDTVLHVCNIPLHISEGYLLYLFSLQGRLSVYSIKKLRDFAFVHYFRRHDAAVALRELNGFNLSGSFIEVTWAKSPNPLTLSKKHKNQKYLIQPRSPSPISIEYLENQSRQYRKNSLQESPVNILSRICQVNGWGEPVYDIAHSSSYADEITTAFIAKVYIPNLPYPVKHFALTETFVSPHVARNFAAEYAMRNIVHFQNSFGSHSRSVLSIDHDTVQGRYVNSKNTWYTPQDIQQSAGSDFLSENAFLDLIASAASLANDQLQTQEEPEKFSPLSALTSASSLANN